MSEWINLESLFLISKGTVHLFTSAKRVAAACFSHELTLKVAQETKKQSSLGSVILLSYDAFTIIIVYCNYNV